MGKEQVRVSVVIADLTVAVGVMDFLGGFTVPRRTIGQLKDVRISALDMTETDGLTDVNWVTIAGLVRGNRDRTSQVFDAPNWGEIDTIVAEMMGVKASGLGPIVTLAAAKLSIAQDFIDGDPRSRINNRSGPQTNFANGFQFFMAGLGEDATKAYMLGTMTIELDWPKNTSMRFGREHVAAEENNDSDVS